MSLKRTHSTTFAGHISEGKPVPDYNPNDPFTMSVWGRISPKKRTKRERRKIARFIRRQRRQAFYQGGPVRGVLTITGATIDDESMQRIRTHFAQAEVTHSFRVPITIESDLKWEDLEQRTNRLGQGHDTVHVGLIEYVTGWDKVNPNAPNSAQAGGIADQESIDGIVRALEEGRAHITSVQGPDSVRVHSIDLTHTLRATRMQDINPEDNDRAHAITREATFDEAHIRAHRDSIKSKS